MTARSRLMFSTRAFRWSQWLAPLNAMLLSASLALLPSAAQAQTQATAARPASAYSAAVATEWFQLALLLTQQTPGFSPPVAARALGYLGLTLYESTVPGMPQNISLAGQLRCTGRPSPMPRSRP